MELGELLKLGRRRIDRRGGRRRRVGLRRRRIGLGGLLLLVGLRLGLASGTSAAGGGGRPRLSRRPLRSLRPCGRSRLGVASSDSLLSSVWTGRWRIRRRPTPRSSSTTTAGMRPLAMRIPSALRRDLANSAAQTFSQIIRAAVLFGSRADPMSSKSSWPSRFLVSTPRAAKVAWVSGPESASSTAATLPSLSLVMRTRSMTLIVPESWSFLMAGMISPENLLPGKAMAMYSTGPMLMPRLLSRVVRCPL